MKNLPVELYDFIIKDLSIQDLKIYCGVDTRTSSYCKTNRISILKRYTKNLHNFDNIVDDFMFLFKNKKIFFDEVFRVLGDRLLSHLDDEYPINQNNTILIKFGEYVAKNWQNYVNSNPSIVLLWYIHTLKSFSSSELKKIFDRIPKSIIKDIQNDSDWFNTRNKYNKLVIDYLKTNYKYNS